MQLEVGQVNHVECLRRERLNCPLTDMMPHFLGFPAAIVGSADITLHRLKSIIGFNHTHGSSRTVCDHFEK